MSSFLLHVEFVSNDFLGKVRFLWAPHAGLGHTPCVPVVYGKTSASVLEVGALFLLPELV